MTRPQTLRALGAAIALVLSGPAAAQQSVVELCRKTSSDADRIACLEAALLARDATPAAPAQVAPAPKPVPAPTQVDPPSMTLSSGAAEASVEPEVEKPAAPVPKAPPPAPSASKTEEPVGIGAEQVIARTQSQDERKQRLEQANGLIVTRYATVPYQKLQVTLENGQVWRQIKGDTQQIRVDLKRNQTVDITESSLSGYKMQLNEIRRSLRVERVR